MLCQRQQLEVHQDVEELGPAEELSLHLPEVWYSYKHLEWRVGHLPMYFSLCTFCSWVYTHVYSYVPIFPMSLINPVHSTEPKVLFWVMCFGRPCHQERRPDFHVKSCVHLIGGNAETETVDSVPSSSPSKRGKGRGRGRPSMGVATGRAEKSLRQRLLGIYHSVYDCEVSPSTITHWVCSCFSHPTRGDTCLDPQEQLLDFAKTVWSFSFYEMSH